jgi:hypothetical protein
MPMVVAMFINAHCGVNDEKEASLKVHSLHMPSVEIPT